MCGFWYRIHIIGWFLVFEKVVPGISSGFQHINFRTAPSAAVQGDEEGHFDFLVNPGISGVFLGQDRALP